MFFALKNRYGGYIVFTDQRMQFGGSDMGSTTIQSFMKKTAKILPNVCANNSILVRCLFTCVSFANVTAHELPENSIVVAYGQNQQYHGTLLTHPASFPFVKINKDPVTFIQMVL